MSTDVVDEVDAHTAGTVIVEVAVQAKGTEVALELFAEERGGLAAAGVAGAVGTHEDEGGVGDGFGAE